MNHDHDLSGAAFAQQRAEEAEALHQNATELMMEYRLLWQQERTKTTRLRAERDAARAAAAAWKRSAKMWRRYACGVRYRREVPYYESVSARPYEPIGDAYVEARND